MGDGNHMNRFMSTREVARLLGINEKKVYSLIAEKGLPASKVAGKWLFPERLVESWLESRTVNYPEPVSRPGEEAGLLVVAGSNDLLLNRAMTLYHARNSDKLVAFANLGSMGGLTALSRGLCHMASSHLFEDSDDEFNFKHAERVLKSPPAVMNFCRREQGYLVAPGNPHNIMGIRDIVARKLSLANRARGTGTRLLLDREIAMAGASPERLKGYEREFPGHLEVGFEVLAGRADAALAIRAVAGLLGLDFVPLRWERFDLVMHRDSFFHKNVQAFLSILSDPEFRAQADSLQGYDVGASGRMVFAGESL